VVTVEIAGEVNTVPFADAGVNQTVLVGSTVSLNGGGSFDDDGDALQYRWTLIAKPAESQAELTDAASPSAAFNADAPGHYVAELIVNDGQLDSSPSQVTISAQEPNAAPVLNPIGNQTVALGTALTLPLSATDPDGDALQFSALNLPLPEGASLDGTTGVFTFKPEYHQIGTLELTFTVSDGRLSDRETIAITVPPINETAATRFTGQLLDANDYANGIVTPIVGATVSFLNNGPAAVSDSQGYFTLNHLDAGTQVLDIDSSTAQNSPAGGPYAGFREQYPLIDHVENVQERPFFLPRIAVDSLTPVDPDLETVVANAELGVTLTVPPHTAKNPDGSDFDGQLSISLVPKGFEPANMPAELDFGQLITIQPVGLDFAAPVPIVFPNLDGLEPGNEVEIWSVDPEQGVFVVVGIGEVSADGQTIQTVSGGIRATDWHAPLAPGVDGKSLATIDCDLCKEKKEEGDSRLTVRSGELSTGFDLPPFLSQGRNRAPAFVYDSQRAWPRPVIPFDATINRRSAVPNSISQQTVLGGVLQNNRTFQSTAGLSESVDETLRMASAIDAAQLQSGIYPYTLRVTNHFDSSSRTAFLSDRVVVVNERQSPFGAGWGLAGLSRLKENSDGRVLIYNGNGKQTIFDRARVDLTLDPWRREGSTNSNWKVSPDGLSVDQTVNGKPTFFVGPEDQINATITGRLRVETTVDDDFIGFVFGYQGPLAANGDGDTDYRFLLFDWKRRYQNNAPQGFTLSRVTGSNAGLWTHTGADVQVLATRYGAGTGWRPNTDYQYELVYSADRIIIRIDGQTIFDVGGSFQPGKFGFYNLSQAQVRYAHFVATSDYESQPGDYSSLKANDDGGFTRTLKNGTQIHFNAEGLQTDVVDRNGNVTHYDYNPQQQLVSITDPVDRVTTFAYLDGHLDTVTDPAGRVTRFQFDDDNNLIKVIFPDG
ncbi:MAG: PKD domain-containing protein, partial [Gammaproteobacteria bacterium]